MGLVKGKTLFKFFYGRATFVLSFVASLRIEPQPATPLVESGSETFALKMSEIWPTTFLTVA